MTAGGPGVAVCMRIEFTVSRPRIHLLWQSTTCFPEEKAAPPTGCATRIRGSTPGARAGGLGAQPQLKRVGGRASFNYTRHVATPALLPTTVVGSYPQPDWLVDRANLSNRLPPRVRAREI